MHKRTRLPAGAPGAPIAPAPLRAPPSRPGPIGAFEAAEVAGAAFTFGLPIVTNHAVMSGFAIGRRSGELKAPVTTTRNDAQVFTWRDAVLPTPGSGTPHSMLWLDLGAEPAVITVPDVPAGRCLSVQVCDSNTGAMGSIGSRARGEAGGSRPLAPSGLSGRNAAGRQGRDPFHHALPALRLPHAAVQRRRHGGGRRQGRHPREHARPARTSRGPRPTAAARSSLSLGATPLPPANLALSARMSRGGNRLPVENPINRHPLNALTLPRMRRNPDGGVTIHIQKDDPGEALRPDRLAAQNAPACRVRRLHRPRTEPPARPPIGAGAWQPPGVVRVA